MRAFLSKGRSGRAPAGESIGLRLPASLHAPDAGQRAGVRRGERERDTRAMVPPAPASRPQISLPAPAGDRDCQLTVEGDLHACCGPFDPPSRPTRSFGDGDVDTGKPVALRGETDSRARAIRQLRQPPFGTQEALRRQEGTRTKIQRLGHKRMPCTFETFDPDGINARFSNLIPRPQGAGEIVLDE